MKIFRNGAYESIYDMPIQINWDLTTRCNYRCSYCFIYGRGKTPPKKLPFSTLNQLKNAVDNIASLNRPWYDVHFSGGEPTIHPHMIDLIYMLHEKLQDRLNHITIISNGSRNENVYEKLVEISKSIYLILGISIHTDHVDMAHILELIEKLSNRVNLSFGLMFNPAKREEVHLIYDIMCEYRKKFPFGMSIDILRDDDHVDTRYTQEDFAWQKSATEKFVAIEDSVASKFPSSKQPKHNFRLFHDIEFNGERQMIESADYNSNLTEGLSKFTGMYCIAHTAVLRIEANGLCHGMVCGADPIICNIFEKGSLKAARDDLIHAIVCPCDICGCSVNHPIPKFSSRLEAARFIEVVDAKQQALFDATQ